MNIEKQGQAGLIRRKRALLNVVRTDVDGPIFLGPSECEVLECVWQLGEANAREVCAQLPRLLVYTTVMTTLDRMAKKRILHRVKRGRTFVYSTSLTKEDVRRATAQSLIASLQGRLLISKIDLFTELLRDADSELLTFVEAALRRKIAQPGAIE